MCLVLPPLCRSGKTDDQTEVSHESQDLISMLPCKPVRHNLSPQHSNYQRRPTTLPDSGCACVTPSPHLSTVSIRPITWSPSQNGYSILTSTKTRLSLFLLSNSSDPICIAVTHLYKSHKTFTNTLTQTPPLYLLFPPRKPNTVTA